MRRLPRAGQSLTIAGCPIDEAAFCERAAQAGNALIVRDIERLVALSRVERFSCTALSADLFPQCKGQPAVQGYATFDGRFQFLLVGRKAYSAHVREILRASNLDVRVGRTSRRIARITSPSVPTEAESHG